MKPTITLILLSLSIAAHANGWNYGYDPNEHPDDPNRWIKSQQAARDYQNQQQMMRDQREMYDMMRRQERDRQYQNYRQLLNDHGYYGR